MRPLAAAAMLLLAACTADTSQHAHPRPPQKPPSPVLAPQDRDFLEHAAQGSNAEVAMGRLVDSRATRPDVIAFGRAMVTDHTAINRRLAAIAARYPIILPTSLGDHQASYDRVVDLRRDEFDREFSQAMIEDHDMAVQLFREEASGGHDPALRAFAAQTLPLIQAHLQHAKALRPPPDSDPLVSPRTSGNPPLPAAPRPNPEPGPRTPPPH
jgi:putative membrane protein